MELLPYLIERDGGLCCFYCKTKLEINRIVYEHLNGNRSDNRPENTVLSCQSCNIKKITSPELQIIAKEKLRLNEDGNFLRERNFVESSDPKNTSTEIDINISNFE